MALFRLTLCVLLVVISSQSAFAAGKHTTLVMVPTANPGFVRNFNPMAHNRLETTFDFVFEPLFIVDKYDSTKIYYRLATQLSYSEDLTSITMDLREGVKWSDGEAFDADDVMFTLDIFKRMPEVDTAAMMAEHIVSAEKLSSHKVKLLLKEKNSLALYELQGLWIVPEHQWKDVDSIPQFRNEAPIGTGAFTDVAKFSASGYTLCRNPHYWDSQNLHIDCIRVPQLQDPSFTIAAQRGELDWFGLSMPDVDKLYVKRDKKHHKYWFPAQDTISLYPNFVSEDPGLNEAYNNLEFRKAMSMAIDREAILEFAAPAATALTNIAGVGQNQSKWMNETVNKQYAKYLQYNVREARKMLKNARFVDKNGDGFVESPSGKPIKIQIDVPLDWSDWVSAVQVIIESFAEAGIHVTMRTAELAEIIQRSRTVGKPNFDMIISFSALGATPHTFFTNAFHSNYQDHCNNNKLQGFFALARYCNAELDKALDAVKQETDFTKRKQHLDRVQEIVAADFPAWVLFSNPTWYQYNTKRFSGWWTADNNKGSPAPHDGNRSRILLVLDLRPI